MILSVLSLSILATGCGDKDKEKESETTTKTGMVVSVEGTVVNISEMDSQGAGNFKGGGKFNPEDFEGKMPEGFENGERPTMPEGFEMPESFEEGERPTMPEGFEEGERPQMSDVESTPIDLKDAHIAVEIDEGKATGSMDDIKTGSFLTITLDEDGKAIEVLVSSRGGFSKKSSAI